jgi:hypothetical protein
MVNFILHKGETVEAFEDNGKTKVIIHFVSGDSYVDIEVVSTSDPNTSKKK